MNTFPLPDAGRIVSHPRAGVLPQDAEGLAGKAGVQGEGVKEILARPGSSS
jgi:hypothetical protein